MATNNVINTSKPIEVAEGGTGDASITAYTVVCAGTTSTGALQHVSSTGSSAQILVSQGAAMVPTWAAVVQLFQKVASDPVSPTVGQVWYNTTSHLYKGARGGATGSWVTKSNMPAAVTQNGGGGIPDDALSFGPTAATYRYTESTDSWASKTNMNLARVFPGGAGASGGDCLAFGGNTYTATSERYDGTGNTWTNKGNMNQATRNFGPGGSAGSAFRKGGAASGMTSGTQTSEQYDEGTNSWTSKATMNNKVYSNAGCGTATDGLSYGGEYSGGDTNRTEQYDGVGNSWTNRANMNLARDQIRGSGTVDQAIGWGGDTTNPVANCESYDTGTNMWTNISSLSFNNANGGYGSTSGPAGVAIQFGGSTTIGTTNITQILQTGTEVVTFTVT